MTALALAPNVPHAHKLTVEEFILLNDSGAFEAFAKSELIDGEIVVLNAQFSRHARIKTELTILLGARLTEMSSALRPIVEVAVRLADQSMPEPDIVVTSYRGNGPVPLDTVAMMIEVSDTTLSTDLGRKAELYAKAGVPEYWVVDVEDNRVLCQMTPHENGYAEQADVPFGAMLIAGTIEGLEVSSAGLS